ncbi:putative Histone-lysine N-methyltransferase SETMAR [Blattamonas nauphoetae]|uniref:Histone-lysine N-methyltransferase SETMAR n=1 Tax=Blattamonas nauphoetae TaxID=2049346 RepID=A0ABQ9Y675_9EUKA|nr:putative Histone-lysine N-methyltransferase SETMAR [Blattamonas nauphoetae]
MTYRRSQEERIRIVRLFYQSGSIEAVIEHWGLPNPPCRITIDDLITKFEETGSVADRPRSGRPRSVATQENREIVQQHYQDHPTESIRQSAHDLNISKSSLHRLIHELGLHPYRLQHTHWLFDQDYEERRRFSAWILDCHQNDPTFVDKIWFSDESRFTLDQTINTHNSYGLYYMYD